MNISTAISGDHRSLQPSRRSAPHSKFTLCPQSIFDNVIIVHASTWKKLVVGESRAGLFQCIAPAEVKKYIAKVCAIALLAVALNGGMEVCSKFAGIMDLAHLVLFVCDWTKRCARDWAPQMLDLHSVSSHTA